MDKDDVRIHVEEAAFHDDWEIVPGWPEPEKKEEPEEEDVTDVSPESDTAGGKIEVMPPVPIRALTYRCTACNKVSVMYTADYKPQSCRFGHCCTDKPALLIKHVRDLDPCWEHLRAAYTGGK